MAHDGGYKAKNVKKFAAGGGFEDWLDLELVGDYAADVGNRKVGTNARRLALSDDPSAADQRWPGLEFHETDTGVTYVYTGTAWRQVSQWGGVFGGNTDAAGLFTVAHPLGATPRFVHATMHFLTGADGVAMILEPVVWIRDASQIRIRLKRTASGGNTWVSDAQPIAVSISASL